MLIDINTYVGHWPFMELKYNNCEAQVERMDRFGTDVSVISSLNGIFYKNTQSANKELYEEINSSRRYRDRFVPFAVINPIYAGCRRDMDVCINQLGMKGIRLYPKYHDYEMTDPALIEVVKRARDMGVPVSFSFRMVDSRQRSWKDIDYVARTAKQEWSMKDIVPIFREVPDAIYLILNVCNSMSLEESDDALFKKANVLMDTSGRSLSPFGKLVNTHGKDRFAFGTHSPILDSLTGLLRIESMRDSEADTATKELLRSGNAIKFLEL